MDEEKPLFQSAGRIFGVWNSGHISPPRGGRLGFNPPGGFLASGTIIPVLGVVLLHKFQSAGRIFGVWNLIIFG